MEDLPRTRDASLAFYRAFLADAARRGPGVLWKAKRWLARNDLFYLMVVVCGNSHVDHPWLFDRCREVAENPNGYLDLWAREHYKSWLITFGLSMQDILASHGDEPEPRYDGREVTIGIFSFNRPAAKAFLRQIKYEFETNETLLSLFPDILWQKPQKQSPKWSEDDGIIVKRKSNPKEATVEAYGVIDGMPTGKHYLIRVYDDLITKEAVTSPDMIQKVTTAWELSDNLGTEGGVYRIIGTRYALFDTYATMMERGIPARIKPCTSDGSEDFSKAVLRSPEFLRQKRNVQGPYTFGCLPGDAPVLMADMSEKPIGEIAVGDMVIGYTFPQGAKTRMQPARVLAKDSRLHDVWEFTLASGRTVRCTPEHKWFTGRRGHDVSGSDSHKTYAPIDTEHRKGADSAVRHLVPMYDPRALNADYDVEAASWLGGFFDGEGAVSGACLHFHQSDRYPAIIAKLHDSLKACGLTYGVHNRPPRKENWRRSFDFFLTGGRQAQMRFLRIAKPAKAPEIVAAMLTRDARVFTGSKVNRDPVVSKRYLGKQMVFNMETETGNYVAYGYATKNSQMLLNPTADKAQGFKVEWLRYWPATSAHNLNIVILVDPASKKKKTNDFTTMWVIGLGGDLNYYVLDVVRDRLNLVDRAKNLFSLHRKWRPRRVGYEEYGLQADIEHMNFLMGLENYRFDITPLGGTLAKEDRIKTLVPIFESGRIYLPATGIIRHNYEGHAQNLIKIFIEEEYTPFPVLMHDDMLDCMARLTDPELALSFPEPRDDDGEPKWMRELTASAMESGDDVAML